jgi:hypothetical protein
MFGDIKIFVGAVNQPSFGQWFTLPISPRKVEEALRKQQVIGPDTGNEEIMISDYEAPFQIMEYESIEKLNRVVVSAQRAIDNGISEQTLVDLIKVGLVKPSNDMDAQVADLWVVKADGEDDLANEVISLTGGISNLSPD